jgi:NitT/TauT family transport system permease protein
MSHRIITNHVMFRTRHEINGKLARVLGIIGLVLFFGSYIVYSEHRHQVNPKDQLTPTIGQMVKTFKAVVTPDEFSEEIPLVEDLKSSLRLFGLGYGAAIACALFLGLHLGCWHWANAFTDPPIKVLSYIPPTALLTLIFLLLGFELKAKTFIIFIATVIPLTRALTLRVQAIPDRQIWKGQTLGASSLEMVWIHVRRIVEPGFLDDVRLGLGTAWVYLIIAELIASDRGLGYRINVAGRNGNIAMILDYIVVVALLAFLMDRAIWLLNQVRNRWAYAGR